MTTGGSAAASEFPSQHPKPGEPWPKTRPTVSLIGVAPGSPEEAAILDALNHLVVGDVLVCRSRSFLSSTTRRFQAAHIYHLDYRKWTHSALYIGRGFIIEKKFGHDWRLLELKQYLRKHEVLVRRPRFEVTPDERTAILGVAITLLKIPYATRRIFQVGWRSIVGSFANAIITAVGVLGLRLRPPRWGRLMALRGLLCNDLVDVCYLDATQRPLVPEELWGEIDYMFLPAAHSWSPALDDVPLP